MSEEKRPGGLTALAVLNFVFGGLGALVFIGALAALAVADRATEGESTRHIREAPNSGLLLVSAVIGLGVVALLIVSGVGYLGQKLIMGRMIGNIYGILGLINFGISTAAVGMQFQNLIGLIYPVLTLLLINITFKDDLVN